MQHDGKLGSVRLVGAGPGSVDLLTVRALRAVQGAEALLYDALVTDEVIAEAPAACVKIRTGKRGGQASLKQDTINRLMLRLARRGLNVVRLKGGDPSIFGRVGEEVDFLRRHGIETEIVPGVTAACAAAAQFSFPLTHRGEARRVVFATGRLGGGGVADCWNGVADPETTLALYMGGSELGELATRLRAAGRDPGTPVLVAESAGRANGRLIFQGVLSELPSCADSDGGPVLVVVGETASRASRVLESLNLRAVG
jgi:uroporphyrin-III C-methyltransferase